MGNIVTGIDLARRVMARGIRPYIAADHHVIWGKDGKICRWGDLAEPERLYAFDFGSSGAIPKMLMLKILGLFTELPMDEVRRLGAANAKLMMPKSFLPTMPPPFVAKRRPKPPKPRPGQHLVIRACRMVCRSKLTEMRPMG